MLISQLNSPVSEIYYESSPYAKTYVFLVIKPKNGLLFEPNPDGVQLMKSIKDSLGLKSRFVKGIDHNWSGHYYHHYSFEGNKFKLIVDFLCNKKIISVADRSNIESDIRKVEKDIEYLSLSQENASDTQVDIVNYFVQPYIDHIAAKFSSYKTAWQCLKRMAWDNPAEETARFLAESGYLKDPELSESIDYLNRIFCGKTGLELEFKKTGIGIPTLEAQRKIIFTSASKTFKERYKILDFDIRTAAIIELVDYYFLQIEKNLLIHNLKSFNGADSNQIFVRRLLGGAMTLGDRQTTFEQVRKMVINELGLKEDPFIKYEKLYLIEREQLWKEKMEKFQFGLFPLVSAKEMVEWTQAVKNLSDSYSPPNESNKPW